MVRGVELLQRDADRAGQVLLVVFVLWQDLDDLRALIDEALHSASGMGSASAAPLDGKPGRPPGAKAADHVGRPQAEPLKVAAARLDWKPSSHMMTAARPAGPQRDRGAPRPGRAATRGRCAGGRARPGTCPSRRAASPSGCRSAARLRTRPPRRPRETGARGRRAHPAAASSIVTGPLLDIEGRLDAARRRRLDERRLLLRTWSRESQRARPETPG